MREEVRRDILDVLENTIVALKSHNAPAIAEQSDRVTHDASIFQDEDSISVAVLVYSIGKIVARCIDYEKAIPPFEDVLTRAVEALKNNDLGRYTSFVKQAMVLVRRSDVRLGVYVEEVIDKARLKKGFKLHEHGLSLSRVAFLLGVSKWDLMSYVGGTNPPMEAGVSVSKRLGFARDFFS